MPSHCLETALHAISLRPRAPYSLWTPRSTFFLSNVTRLVKVSKHRECEIAVVPRGRYASRMSQSGVLKVEGILGNPLPVVTGCAREAKEKHAFYFRSFSIHTLDVVCRAEGVGAAVQTV
jgi:hypothetical protein